MRMFNKLFLLSYITTIGIFSCTKSEYKENFICECNVDRGLLYKNKQYSHYIYDSEEDARTKCIIIEDDYQDEVHDFWGSANCFLTKDEN